MALVLAGVAFVALSGLRGVSPDDAGASGPDVTASQALAGILLTLLSQFVGAHLHPLTHANTVLNEDFDVNCRAARSQSCLRCTLVVLTIGQHAWSTHVQRRGR